MLVLLCSTGFEAALMRESALPARTLAPGVVAAQAPPTLALAETDFIFARQILPDAREVRASSIGKLADAALAEVLAPLEQLGRPFRLDLLVPDDPVEGAKGELSRRIALVGEALLERLKERRRKIFRRLVAEPIGEGECAVAQLLLVARDHLFTSVVAPVTLAGGGRWPSPLAGGRVLVADDWDAPSSAFRKLEEAFVWLGRAIEPGQRCVDLGASPGGWTHVALRRGASVVAVDRAELDARVSRRPGLLQVRRDGFSYEPERPPVDWLLCDIIAAPEKSLALLSRWVEARLCDRLVFHLKFKGKEGYGLAKEVVPLLRAGGFARHRVKHLLHDRNEVTVMASRM